MTTKQVNKNIAQAELMISKAKAQLVISQPFFASILLRRPLKFTTNVPTLAVDAKAQMFANPDFVVTLSVPQLVWALAHETMHIVCQHATRKAHRQHEKWNIAGDAFINDTITTAGVGEPIDGTVKMPGSKDKTTETIYDELPDMPPGGGSGGQQPDFGGDLIEGDGGDDGGQDGKGRTMSAAEVSEVEAQTKVEVAQAAQAARMQGKLPAGMDRFIESILEVKTPWYDILERFMTSRAQNDYSWARPNRRYVASSLYLPSMQSEAAMGEIVIAVDTSGSVGARELAEFGGHINRIMETCRPEKVHVIYCDADVNKVSTFTKDELPIALEAVGGGGTDFRPVFDYVAEHNIEPACLVYLTDGYGEYGSEPVYPVLWAMVSDYKAPWGECVYVEADA